MKILIHLFFITVLIGTVSSQAFAKIINVKRLGAIGDGKTDDTKAVQMAINSSNKNLYDTIYFPKGIYQLSSFSGTKNYLENYFLLIHPNIVFKGNGKATIIRLGNHLFDKKDTTANGHLFYGTNISNVRFIDLSIDMNGCNNLTPEMFIKNQCAIFINGGNNISLNNVTIKNNAGRNMIIILGTGQKILIEKCTFLNGGHNIGTQVNNQYQPDFSFVYCEWDSTSIINNRIEQQNIDIALTSISGGIELHGSNSYAAGNKIIGCNPGLYISSSRHPMEKTTVEKNQFIQCLRGISFWVNYQMRNITIANNIIQLTYSRTWKPYIITGIEMPNGNTSIYDFKHANASFVENLLIAGNKIFAPLQPNKQDRTAGMVLHSLKNSKIINNEIMGMNFGGVIIQGSKSGATGISISNNKFIDFKINYDKVSPSGYVVIFDSYILSDKTAPGVKNITVSENVFLRNNKIAIKNSAATEEQGKFFGAFVALPKYMLPEIHFDNNHFSDKVEKVELLNTTPN